MSPPRGEKRIAYDSGKAIQRYGPEGPPLDEVLRRRLETFGAANTYRIPRPPRFGELLGLTCRALVSTGAASW